jgi:uncharacterized membrane protein
MIALPPVPRRVPFAAIPRALAAGWALLKARPALSCGYAAVFALIGLVLLGGVALAGMTPLALPLAGGFMLVGPVLLAGYFRVARLARRSQSPQPGDLLDGFRRAPRPLWVIALVCMLLFMIWITDAATLYSFMIGREPVWLGDLAGHADALRFQLYGSIMGGALAFAIYTVSAFSVPLLAEGRTGLIGAVSASARAVFANFFVAMAWALVLAAVTIFSILLLPLFVVALPWLAYSSYALYGEIFPE